VLRQLLSLGGQRPLPAATVDDAPEITEDDQRILLLHGIAFAMEFGRLVCGLDQPSPVRCIVAANETNVSGGASA
jgi:hypothetical protein